MAVTWKKLVFEDDVLLITGATTGATVQAQPFTNGVVAPYIAPAADGTTAVQIRKADKTTGVLTVDTTNGYVSIGGASTGSTLHVEGTPGGSGTATFVMLATYNAIAGGTQYAFSTKISSAEATGNSIGIGIRTGVTANPRSGLWLEASQPGLNLGFDSTVTAPTNGLCVAGNSVFGGTTPLADSFGTHLLNVQTTSNVGLQFSRFSANAGAPVLSIVKSRNATIGLHTAAQAADRAGTIAFGASDGSAFDDIAQIYAEVDAVTSGTVMSGRVGIKTTNTSGTSVTRLLIDDDGQATNYAGLIVNENGGSAATDDFRAESDTEANMLWLDSSADLLYLGGSTNGLSIAKGGDLTLLGTAKYERHVQLDAVATGAVANQPTPADFFTAGGLQYPTTGAKYAFCQWEVPDDWDGTDIVFEVDWFPDSGAISGTAAVRWTVEYRSIAEGEAINNGTSVTVDNGAGGDTTDYAQYITKHTRFTLTYNNANQPLTAQDHIYFKISRDTAVANDFGGSVTVTAYEVIYQSKGFPTSN